MVVDMTPNRRAIAQTSLRRSDRQALAHQQHEADTTFLPAVDDSDALGGADGDDDAGLLTNMFDEHHPRRLNERMHSPIYDPTLVDYEDELPQGRHAFASVEPEDSKHDGTRKRVKKASSDIPSENDPLRLLPDPLQLVNIHQANLTRFNNAELLRIHKDDAACLKYDLSGLVIVQKPHKSTKNPVKSKEEAKIPHFQTETLGSFHIKGHRGVRGTVGRPPLRFANGTELLWQVGCFNEEGNSPSTVHNVTERAMRESYKLAPKSADGKVAMRSAGNTVSKRISKCLLKWFGCTYCSELPRDVNELRDPMADDFAGVLRSYCEPDNLEAIDYDEARRAAGVRPADQMDTVPDSCERGFLVPAGSQKKRSQAHLDDRVSDDDDNDGVASKPEKKRACGKKRVRTDEADEAGPSSKRQRHPSMPTSCSGMEGLVDPGLQQLPQQLLQYPTQHPQREQPQDIAALYGMPVHNRQRAAYLPNVTPGHPEVDYGTFDPALDGLGAAVVPEMMPSTNNASNNAQQMANGTSGMVTINAENRMPGHFTDLEVYMQQMMMRQLGPIHDDQGQLVTDWGRYAMRIIDRNFGFRFF